VAYMPSHHGIQPASGLSTDQASAQQPVLPQPQGSEDRAAPANARDGEHARALRLSAGAHSAQARRLEAWAQPGLSAVQ